MFAATTLKPGYIVICIHMHLFQSDHQQLQRSIMESIPIDLVLEIFLRFPSKSIERFRCLSKLWSSLLHRLYFTELFLTRSSARPRLLFAIEQYEECCFFSSPQLQNPYDKSSLVLAADFHTKFSGSTRSYDSGLIFLRTRTGLKPAPMICNPNTGQYVKLPKQGCSRSSYIGFDPIDKEFKVLSMANRFAEESADHKILTLGTGKLRWRKIHCPLPHGSSFQSICINGVLYYLSTEQLGTHIHTIFCFDVRSEKFKLIDGDYRECFQGYSSRLVNYKGKLGLVFWRSSDYDEEDAKELRLWVLEDVERQVWSNYVYTLPKIEVCHDPSLVSVVGVTAMGQIVLSMFHYIPEKPFYVFYFNPQDKTLLSVEIQGFEGFEVDSWAGVRTYVEHVEDLNVSDAKLFRSSNSVPSVKNKTTTSRRGKRKRWFT